ncbi:MAG TPA: c-type cytochrome [Thermodesulfovibrionales bacterium]|nr:c-type cytochrome [Thermodesulfovibrionales bacterium]
MKRSVTFSLVVVMIFVCAGIGFTKEAGKKSGETLFKEYCAPCHPDGGNVVNAKKSLHKKDLDANKIKKPGDIVKKMRNPGPSMTKFDKKTIPDKEAKEIAEYILKTFK